MNNLMFKGDLLTADFEEKTMTFEIENDMVVQAGNYTIIPTDIYERLVNGVEQNDIKCNKHIVIGSALNTERKMTDAAKAMHDFGIAAKKLIESDEYQEAMKKIKRFT